MINIFNINIEFDKSIVYNKIVQAINDSTKGFCFFVDSNIIRVAFFDIKYRNLINSSLVNSCDGSSIAFFANIFFKLKVDTLKGPEVFKELITRPYRQVLLGGNADEVNKILTSLSHNNLDKNNIFVYPLPFNSIDSFNYEQIADDLNRLNVDIIWVSLGAPKQELFINNLFPLLNKGLLFGIGAAFNFYNNPRDLDSFKFFGLEFIWVNRIFKEPQKQLKRVVMFVFILPMLLAVEFKKVFSRFFLKRFKTRDKVYKD